MKFVDADKIRELVKDPETKYIPVQWLESLIDQAFEVNPK